MDCDVPLRPSYEVYISQLEKFSRLCFHVHLDDFNARNKCLTNKLFKQGYRYHEPRKAFSKFYRRHHELISKFNVGLKSLLHKGLSEPEFYGNSVYKFKIMGMADLSSVLESNNTLQTYWLYLNVMRQSACLVINPVAVYNIATLLNCTPVDLGVRLNDGPDLKLFILVVWDRTSFVCCMVLRGLSDDLVMLNKSSGVV